jgi:TolA-binding protein
MSKMGDYAGSISLLALNARDYARSSSSAFALGRAYRSAGEIDRARLEFKRAIELDPSNKKASDALTKLDTNHS